MSVKNKTLSGRIVRSAVIPICLFSLYFVLSIFMSLSFFRLACNGFGLRAGGHFESQNCQFITKFISCNTLQITTICPLAFSPCYKLAVLVLRYSVFNFCCIVFLSVCWSGKGWKALWQNLVVALASCVLPMCLTAKGRERLHIIFHILSPIS